MAVTQISRIKTRDVNVASDGFTFTPATAAADGFEVDFQGKDNRTVIVATNTVATAGTLTVKGSATSTRGGQDIVLSVPASKSIAFTLDSAYFMETAGTKKGKVTIIPSATTISIAAIEPR